MSFKCPGREERGLSGQPESSGGIGQQSISIMEGSIINESSSSKEPLGLGAIAGAKS
jgi:hypothetical protein